MVFACGEWMGLPPPPGEVAAQQPEGVSAGLRMFSLPGGCPCLHFSFNPSRSDTSTIHSSLFTIHFFILAQYALAACSVLLSPYS